MLNTLPTPILLDIAIIFTALSWGLGFYVADKKVYFLRRSPSVVSYVCSGTAWKAWARLHG
jgi:hypothetical protein